MHKRKRIHLKEYAPYPHPEKTYRILDRLLLGVAILGPLLSIPQIIKIYYFKDATSISSISFLLFSCMNILWIFYGAVHKDKPLTIANCLWFLANLSIFFGAVFYG